jgi:HlyD family secretion protein
MKRKIMALIILLAILSSVGGAVWFRTAGAISNENMPKSLRTFFSDSSTSSIIELQGNVEIREVRLGFEVSSRISKMLVDEGDRVGPGQLVAELDPEYFADAARQAEASLKVRTAELLRLKNGSRAEEIAEARANTLAARVTFQNAQKEFLRNRELITGNAISQENFDRSQAESDRTEARLRAAEATQKIVETGPRAEDISRAQALVEQDQAQLGEAKRRLKDSKLFTPSGGVIQTKVHEPGDHVNVGEPVYTITISDPVWVRTYINEMDLGRIRPGMEAAVSTDTGKSYRAGSDSFRLLQNSLPRQFRLAKSGRTWCTECA